MKRFRSIRLAPFAIALALAAMPARARAQDTVRADIPFEFTAGWVALPAGVYTVTVDRSDRAVAVREDETGKSVFVPMQVPLVTKSNGSLSARLVFSASGASHALSEVWLDDSTGIRVGALGRQERLAARIEVRAHPTHS